MGKSSVNGPGFHSYDKSPEGTIVVKLCNVFVCFNLAQDHGFQFLEGPDLGCDLSHRNGMEIRKLLVPILLSLDIPRMEMARHTGAIGVY